MSVNLLVASNSIIVINGAIAHGVPAKNATIGIIDKVLPAVAASIYNSGESTFIVRNERNGKHTQ